MGSQGEHVDVCQTMRRNVVQILLLALVVSLALFSYIENDFSGVVYSSKESVNNDDHDNSFFRDGKNFLKFLKVIFSQNLFILVKVMFHDNRLSIVFFSREQLL